MPDPLPQPLPGPQPASFDEKLKDFDNVPLFMRSLPCGADDTADTTAIEALQSLVHEGTPDEIAQNFKEQGNEYFKGKRYREAQGFYTQGINANPTGGDIREALLCNRAACNLELQNYGSVLADCASVLTINPKSSKAFYRAALALISLGREDEALDGCDRCLQFDPSNNSLKVVQERASNALKLKRAAEKVRKEREQKERDRKAALDRAFAERNLISAKDSNGSNENPYDPHFIYEGSGSKLVIPTIFLYPQYATSDMISHFVEDTRFEEHLMTMFPPDGTAPGWDAKGEYSAGQLVVYGITVRRRLLKVGTKMTLMDVMYAAKDGLELRDGCLSFVVLPKGKVEADWIAEFKSNGS